MILGFFCDFAGRNHTVECHRACDNDPACQMALGCHQGPLKPRHVFTDICARIDNAADEDMLRVEGEHRMRFQQLQQD
eukprot:11461487-Alexandrium_andersonii.AAC.1